MGLFQKPLGVLFDLIAGIVPLDLQTQRSGDYISLKNAQGVVVLVFKGAGTDNDDPTFTFNQATAVAGTGAKGLNISEYWEKEGTLTAVGTWTRVTQTAASTVAPGDPSAQSQAMYAFQIDAEELDVNNGFDCLSVDCSDVGNNAQLGCIVYILYGLSHPSAPETLPNSIID